MPWSGQLLLPGWLSANKLHKSWGKLSKQIWSTDVWLRVTLRCCVAQTDDSTCQESPITISISGGAHFLNLEKGVKRDETAVKRWKSFLVERVEKSWRVVFEKARLLAGAGWGCTGSTAPTEGAAPGAACGSRKHPIHIHQSILNSEGLWRKAHWRRGLVSLHSTYKLKRSRLQAFKVA